ncbi:MAG: dihydrofolate reductase family protein [Acidobacteria bacterium]|nr:dihydrofolate reductase family protein [Acidobacteriota bacterium]
MSQHWTDRFAQCVREKTAAATAATIPGYVTAESHGADLELGIIGNAWTFERFDGPFYESSSVDPTVPAVNVVFVQSADGNTGSDNPTSLGGGATDKHLIYEGLSGAHADALLSAPGTVGGSQTVMAVWHPELVRLRTSLGLPRFPAQVVATRRGQLAIDAELLYNVPEVPVFILTTDEGAHALRDAVGVRPWITVISTGLASDLKVGLQRLHADHGIRRVSCTGGRHVTTALIDAGVVRDIYLTTSPLRGGEPDTPFYLGPKPLPTTLVVRKTGRGDERGVVFEHLALQP